MTKLDCAFTAGVTYYRLHPTYSINDARQHVSSFTGYSVDECLAFLDGFEGRIPQHKRVAS